LQGRAATGHQPPRRLSTGNGPNRHGPVRRRTVPRAPATATLAPRSRGSVTPPQQRGLIVPSKPA